MADRDFSKPRPTGSVRVRWLGESEAIEHEGTVVEVLVRVVERWFQSNHSPDAFVLPIVIERDGKQMSDEEADAYLLDQLALKRATRGP